MMVERQQLKESKGEEASRALASIAFDAPAGSIGKAASDATRAIESGASALRW
jgi:hypothetical protein